jgi:hypothetical protein
VIILWGGLHGKAARCQGKFIFFTLAVTYY